jgi:hypothetical protein
MKVLYGVSALILLSCYSCKKGKETQLTEATHVGANTMSCLVDGRVFVTSGLNYSPRNIGVSFSPHTNTAWFILGKTSTEQITLEINYNLNPSIPGKFEIADNYPAGAGLHGQL